MIVLIACTPRAGWVLKMYPVYTVMFDLKLAWDNSFV